MYLSPKDKGEGGITVSATPPRKLSDKALFFLKCSHASKLSRESIGQDVVYSECSTLPLGKQQRKRLASSLGSTFVSACAFLQVKKAERGLGTRLVKDYSEPL